MIIMADRKQGLLSVIRMGKEAHSLLAQARQLSLRSLGQQDLPEYLLLRMRAISLQVQALEILKKCTCNTRALLEEDGASSDGRAEA
jgi:hypothetical protein